MIFLHRTTWSRPWSLYVLNEWVKQNLGGSARGEIPIAGRTPPFRGLKRQSNCARHSTS